MSSPLLKEWFVSFSFQSIVSMYRVLASMENTLVHCNISLNELDSKFVLVFHCKNGEEWERVREKDNEKKTKRETKTKRERNRKGKKENGRKRKKE